MEVIAIKSNENERIVIEHGENKTPIASTRLNSLVINKDAALTPPEGKMLTLTVDGVSVPPVPGEYEGDIELTISDPYVVDGKTDAFLHGKDLPIRAAYYVKDGVQDKNVFVPAVFRGGEMDEKHAKGVKCVSLEDDFTGIIVENSEYTLTDCEFDFTGEGANDNYGVGAAVLGLGKSKITLDNVKLTVENGVTRALTYVADETELTVRNSSIINHSGPTTRMSPAWMLGLRGTNRPTQLCDSASAVYTNCYVESNGWGLFSVEGATKCSVLVKDSTAVLRGDVTRGYGMMSIGNCVDTFDNSKVSIQGYAFLICNPGSQGVITGGSDVEATVYGAMIFRNHNGKMTVNKGSKVTSGQSMFVVKGSQTTIDCDDCTLNAGNGIILQLMDNDEPGMQRVNFKPSNDEEDVYAEGRDLTVASPDDDIFARFSNMELKGNMFNSTTNLFLQTRGDAGQCPGMPVPDFDLMPKPDPNAPLVRGTGLDLQGAHNLDITLDNVRYTGCISSAKARYKEGLSVIDPENREELSNVSLTAAPPINNGVIVHLSGNSVWNVTGTSYITRLSVEEGAKVLSADGTPASITVNGEKVSLTAGEYSGNIVIA